MTPFLLPHNLKDDLAYLVHNTVFLKYVTACSIPSEKVTRHFK